MADPRKFTIPEKKPVFSRWHISVDISGWLAGDTIQNVNFTATDKSTGDDATGDILDPVKCIWTDGILKPYILDGESGKTYVIKMEVYTVIDDREVWWVTVPVI